MSKIDIEEDVILKTTVVRQVVAMSSTTRPQLDTDSPFQFLIVDDSVLLAKLRNCGCDISRLFEDHSFNNASMPMIGIFFRKLASGNFFQGCCTTTYYQGVTTTKVTSYIRDNRKSIRHLLHRDGEQLVSDFTEGKASYLLTRTIFSLKYVNLIRFLIDFPSLTQFALWNDGLVMEQGSEPGNLIMELG